MAVHEATRNFRMTPQRQAVLDAVREADGHPTADDIYERARRSVPRISLGTVYRSLELLAEHGFIRRLDTPGGTRRYDGETAAHDHIRCTRCGRVQDVHVPAARLDTHTVAEETGYAVTGRRLEFTGLCPRCQRRQARHRDASE